MESNAPTRPALESVQNEAEFARWYWTKDELTQECRRRGLVASGAKADLAARITASLAGAAQPLAKPRVAATRQLSAPLFATTLIPVGQRSSQIVRAWLTEQIGPSFHFDAEMREFIGQSDGTRTLGGAVEHWAATRNLDRREIGAQFELNRFTREWHELNPTGDRDQALAAWQAHRALPIELR